MCVVGCVCGWVCVGGWVCVCGVFGVCGEVLGCGVCGKCICHLICEGVFLYDCRVCMHTLNHVVQLRTLHKSI